MKKLFLLVVVCFSFLLVHAQSQKSDFVMWQLPSQINTHGNSYVFRMNNGKVVVMDGGVKEETPYLRGFLAALGNHVEAWFISHPHFDHMGALNEILKDPRDIKIKCIYHSELPEDYYSLYEKGFYAQTKDFYDNLKKSGIPVVNYTKPGTVIQIGKTSFKILGVRNLEITENQYNNQSMVIRVWDKKKSMLFLADLGREAGDKLLNGPYRKELNCDYVQLAHHGQKGVSKDFYRSIKFRACMWPTPLWLYNNDSGKGYNTGHWETVEIRNLMDELGIKEQYISWKGLCRIE